MSAPSPSVEQLVEQCQGLVRSLATGIARKLPPHVEMDDLIEYGQLGLVEAAREYDPGRGGQFSTYAYYRIRGAIYDGLAKMSWFSRAQYRRIRYEQMASEVLRTEEEQPREAEPAGTEQEVCHFRDLSRALAVVYLASHRPADDEDYESSALVDASTPEPSAAAIGRELSQKLTELIDSLPSQEAALIRAAYFEGLTLQEAGQRLGISKAWASRLHARTLQRLGRSLKMLEMPAGT